MRRHRKLVIALTAVALAALGGGAYAATQTNTNPRQAYLDDLAKRLNVSPAQLSAAMKGALLDQIDAAVKAGRITQAQANAIKQRIESGQAPPFFFGFHARRFFGPRLGFAPGLRAGGPLGAAATYLGLTDVQLFQDLASGQSLAQVAKARGKSVSGLEQAMVDAARTRLDRAVKAGRLTKTQEQQLLSGLQAKVAAAVNRTRPMLRFHGQWAPGEGPALVPAPGGGPPGPPVPGEGPPMPSGPAGFAGPPPGPPA